MYSGPLNTLATKEAPSIIASVKLALNLAMETVCTGRISNKKGASRAKRSTKVFDVGAWYFYLIHIQ